MSALIVTLGVLTTQALAGDVRGPGGDRRLDSSAASHAAIGCGNKGSWSKSGLSQDCGCLAYDIGQTLVASPGPTVPMNCRQQFVERRLEHKVLPGSRSVI
jgi:hypothetical protein